MLKVAVIGTGTMGSTHAKAYRAMPNVELTAVVDSRMKNAEALAGLGGTQAFASLETMLASVAVDVVDVCVPTPFHRVYVERAAAAGKHVICEKPLARTVEDGEAMIQACRDAGVKLFVAHVVRFFPEYRRAFDIVQSGGLGDVGTVRTVRGGAFPNAWNDWYANFQWSGGVLLDLMIHDIDFLRWCFGDVERVFSKAQYGREFRHTDHALLSIRFRNGVIGHVEGSWAWPSGFRTSYEFAGTAGLLTYDSEEATPIRSVFKSTTEGAAGVSVPESPLSKSPYAVELEHFIRCLETGEEPLVTAEDALAALRISLAGIESAKTGLPVQLGQA